MNRIQATALFCDDIREEVGGKSTIIGILPDNFQAPEVPGAIPKLGMYIRLHFPVELEARDIPVFLTEPNGDPNQISIFERDVIAKTITEAKAKGNVVAGLTLTAIASPFWVKSFGRFVLQLDTGDDAIFLGSLNVEQSGGAIAE